MSIAQFLTDLLNPDLRFLPRALAVVALSAAVCGVVGTHVVLRGMAFLGDAVAHAVFPGLAVAFVTQGSLVVGGVTAGLVTSLIIAVVSQVRRIREDSVIGIFFVAAFALGIVVISRAPGYAGSLQQFLFGSITGIPDRDLYVVAFTALVVLVVLFAFHKELVAVSVDRELARAMGLAVFRLDVLLYLTVTLAVVISVQTIGNILVVALLITPAATARMLTDRLVAMMALSSAIGAIGATIGLYLSWSYDLPVGGTIVLVLTAAFLATWFLAPGHGLVASFLGARRRADDEPGPDGHRARRALGATRARSAVDLATAAAGGVVGGGGAEDGDPVATGDGTGVGDPRADGQLGAATPATP